MLFPVLLIVLVFVLAVAFADRSAPDTRGGSTAQRVLDERLAAGEITAQEHAERRRVLGVSRVASRGPRTALVIGGAALLVLLLLGLAWQGGSGWSWGDGNWTMGGHMGWRTSSGNSSAPVSGAEELKLSSTEMRFEPATLEVTAGEPVNITLTNDGRVFHDLTIPALGFKLDADPGDRVTGGLTADRTGTYEFYCSVPGHAAGGMRGTLVVRGGGAA